MESDALGYLFFSHKDSVATEAKTEAETEREGGKHLPRPEQALAVLLPLLLIEPSSLHQHASTGGPAGRRAGAGTDRVELQDGGRVLVQVQDSRRADLHVDQCTYLAHEHRQQLCKRSGHPGCAVQAHCGVKLRQV